MSKELAKSDLDNIASLQADLLDLTHDAIMVRDMSGVILFWNKGAKEMYGFSRDQALGQVCHQLLQTRFPSPVKDIEAEALSKGRWDGELVNISAKGYEVTVLSRWAVSNNSSSEPQAFLEINSDITEQRSAERKGLRDEGVKKLKAKERTEELASAAQLLRSKVLQLEVSDRDRDLKVKERIVELAASKELLRSKVVKLERADEDRRLRVKERITELAASEQLLLDKANELIKADAERELRVQERIVELAASEKLLQSKVDEVQKADVQRALKVQERITELAASERLLHSKVLEAQSADIQRELKVKERIVELAVSEDLLHSKTIELEKADIAREQKVQERIVEMAASEELLNSKILELESSNEELQQFAYVCSHDLQEPLRVISNYSQLIARRYTGKLDDKADQFIGFTVDAAKRMQNLINDLLAYSRLQKIERVLGAIDCNEVLKITEANLSLKIEESGAIIRHEALPVVRGDKSQLSQLFQNLIANAITFRSDKPPEIDISAYMDGEWWHFTVKDNGIGFDMHFAERIFLIFQRLHTREEYPGSGMGLAICKKIVTREGGVLTVDSELGKGSAFHFTVPAIKAESTNE